MSSIAELIIRNSVYPLWAKRNHPGLYSFLREYERTQFWSPDQIQELQWHRLQKIVQFAFQRCPYYRDSLRQVGFSPGDLRNPKDFLCLPVLTKEDIRRNQERLLADGISPESYEDNYTGGSTGSPISFKVSKSRWASRKATGHRHDSWSGWRVGKRLGVLWGHPGEFKSRSLRERLSNALIYRQVLLNTFDANESSFDLFLEELRKENVHYLLAYSRSLLLFARYLVSRGIDPPPFEAAITSAECLAKEERDFIERTLRCPTFDRYGCREFSIIASECEAHQGLHISSETLFVEFMVGDRPARPGEVGEILVTDLLNEAMPFIRYRIGDMGAPMDGLCPCGRGLPRMEMVAGRTTDFLHTPEGKWISGIAINTYLISKIPGIEQAQIVQDQCDHIRFRLIASGQRTIDAERFLCDQVPKMFGARMRYCLEWTTRIPPEPSGKTRVTISNCALTHGLADSTLVGEKRGLSKSFI